MQRKISWTDGLTEAKQYTPPPPVEWGYKKLRQKLHLLNGLITCSKNCNNNLDGNIVIKKGEFDYK